MDIPLIAAARRYVESYGNEVYPISVTVTLVDDDLAEVTTDPPLVGDPGRRE